MLRLSELYTSTQGEGQHVGKMTVFCRFAGCNMRCAGWPCDTPHAILPEIWRHESERLAPPILAARIMALCEDTGATHVCYTGGEPFMQQERDLYELTRILIGHDLSVEVFTNGSFIFPEWVGATLDVMMDWKLAGSLEDQTHRDERFANAFQLRDSDGIKFVVKDFTDCEEAFDLWKNDIKTRAQFWVGTAWDQLYERDIVEFIKANKLPWRLNVQVHKYIWPADERGV